MMTGWLLVTCGFISQVHQQSRHEKGEKETILIRSVIMFQRIEVLSSSKVEDKNILRLKRFGEYSKYLFYLFFSTMFRFDESVVLGHDFLFWCHSLGYSCVKEDTDDSVGLQELVWFENLFSENKKKTNRVIISHLATANSYDDQVWFENIIENKKLSEDHPGNKDMQMIYLE